jgi:protease-4
LFDIPARPARFKTRTEFQAAMSLETEIVLDRRQLRRRLSLWRGIAVTGLVLLIGGYVLSGDSTSGVLAPKHIARVNITGTITEDRTQLEMLRKVRDAKNVAGVIVFVNSPGGTTTGGEAIYEELRQIAEKKPVVGQFGTVAASAGYIVGLGTDHIVSRGNTITGSVGVLMQWPEFSELLGKIGVKMNELKSGDLKASPSLFAPADEPALAVARDMIDESFRWFGSLVETRRGIKLADVPGLEKGRIFSGRDALKHKLVDEIGGEAEAKRWLQDKRGIDKDLKVIDWKPATDTPWGLSAAITAAFGNLFGAQSREVAEILSRTRAFATLGLDGMLSVWQPPEN